MATAHESISHPLFLFSALRTSTRIFASQEQEQGQSPPFLSFPNLHANHKNPAHRATNIGVLTTSASFLLRGSRCESRTQYQRRHATLSPSRLWVEDESNVWRESLLQGADPSSMDCSNAETRHFIFPSLRSLMLLPSPLSSSCSFADRRGV
jgi:hypothetical protein